MGKVLKMRQMGNVNYHVMEAVYAKGERVNKRRIGWFLLFFAYTAASWIGIFMAIKH